MATITSPCVMIQQPDGHLVGFNASADTDVARGTAFLAALAAAVSPEIVLLGAGGFDVVANQIVGANGVSVRGAGWKNTTIYTQHTTKVCCLPGNDSIWEGFTLHANHATAFQNPFGTSFGETRGFTNVILRDVQIIGAVDCVFFQAIGAHQVTLRMERVKCLSDFDCMNAAIAGANSQIDIIDCDFNSTTPSGRYPSYAGSVTMGEVSRPINSASANCAVNVYGGSFIAGGGSITNTACAATTTGKVFLYGPKLTSSGTAALDISSSGSLQATVGCYDPTKVTGTVVTLAPYGAAQTVNPSNDDGAGSTILPGVTSVVVGAVVTDANDWILLPAIAAVPIGHTIRIACNAGTNFEMRTPAASNTKINDVDADGGAAEYLCTDTDLIIVTKHTTTGWVAQSLTKLGAVRTAVIPD